MKHDEARLAFSRRLDEDLEPGLEAGLREHLDACSACREYTGALERLVEGGAPAAVPAGLHAAVMARVRATPQAGGAPRGLWLLAALAAAGGLYVLASSLAKSGRLSPAAPAAVKPESPPPELPSPPAQAPASAKLEAAAPELPSPAPAQAPAAAKLEAAAPELPSPAAEPPQARPESPAARRKELAAHLSRKLAGPERLLHRLPAPAPRLVLRGRAAPGGAKPLGAALAEEGLPEVAASAPLMELLDRRHARAKRVAELKRKGKLGEGRDGLLSTEFPDAEPLSRGARELLAGENRDRLALFEAYAEALLKDSGLPARERVEAARRSFAAAARELAEPGEWLESEEGDWRRKE